MGYSIDGTTKTISLTSGTTQFSVRDLWSRWVDWFLTSDNSKYSLAFLQVGGNDIDLLEGTKIPIYLFMQNGWKIKPQEADHTLNVKDGILLVEGGGDPFIDTTGAFTVRVNYQQPVQAISFSNTGGGGSSPEDISTAVWAKYLEAGVSATDVLKIMLSILAGKTTITDLGNGNATVTFRDINDMRNAVVATMNQSQRTNITITP